MTTTFTQDQIDNWGLIDSQIKALTAELNEAKALLKEALPEGGKLIGKNFVALVNTFDPKEVTDEDAIFEAFKAKYADEYAQLANQLRKVTQTATRVSFK